ncbi:hypothetical protein BST65_03305 [Bradyrhizobium canariense]|nr:hypothetical protein BST65_03305 [Bradyrhizobium canariense]OSI36957.1 hypothetical protein BST66_04665 [Bradyrhizobium canariense]OSI55795.1 hypothetical protein BSZ20_01440 [Bradyrhizobium canariense]OSI57787.1 hypothetical protein BST67_01405 [Bradyrhizobium canariense]OSI59081.1 hypothetical protein BSZ15_06405 [Bradyrhizobium canariense]
MSFQLVIMSRICWQRISCIRRFRASCTHLHSRQLPSPAEFFTFAFDTSGARAEADRNNLAELCNTDGLAIPSPEERYHRVQLGALALRWEQHSEFVTYTWETPSETDVAPFNARPTSLASAMTRVPQPGPLLVALDLHLLPRDLPAHQLDFIADMVKSHGKPCFARLEQKANIIASYKLEPCRMSRFFRGLQGPSRPGVGTHERVSFGDAAQAVGGGLPAQAICRRPHQQGSRPANRGVEARDRAG